MTASENPQAPDIRTTHIKRDMADSRKPVEPAKPEAAKSLTKVERLKEPDGTFEITYVEQSRRKLTTKDELIPILADLMYKSEQAIKQNWGSIIGEKDIFVAFAERFVGYLEDDPSLFDDFLNDIRDWPRDAKKGLTT